MATKNCVNVTPERLHDAFQKATPDERKPVLKLIEKYATMDEADVKLALLDMVERVYHPQSVVLRSWLDNATISPKDERPRYVEGIGIYVPIVGKYLDMSDRFLGNKVDWSEAVRVGAPTRDEWYIILYFKAEINRLLRDNGGEELEGWYWASTEASASSAWRISPHGYVNSTYKLCQNLVRTWITF